MKIITCITLLFLTLNTALTAEVDIPAPNLRLAIYAELGKGRAYTITVAIWRR